MCVDVGVDGHFGQKALAIPKPEYVHVHVCVIVDVRVVVDVDDRFSAKSICEAKSEHFYSQGDSHLCRVRRRDCLFQIFFLA